MSRKLMAYALRCAGKTAEEAGEYLQNLQNRYFLNSAEAQRIAFYLADNDLIS